MDQAVALNQFDPANFKKYESPGFTADRLAQAALRNHINGKNAIGRNFKVTAKDKTFVSGVIVDVSFHRFQAAGRSYKAIWEIKLEAGVNKTVHTKYVDCLPRG